MESDKDKLLDHDYDGIRELDNDLPRWWVWLFIGTVVFAVLYMLYFHVLHIGYSSTDAYRAEINPTFQRERDLTPTYLGILPKYRSPYASRESAAEKKEAAESRTYFPLTRDADTTTYIALTDPGKIAAGNAIFEVRCVSCHGKHGEGGIGPNLTDKYWLHGSAFPDVVKTIRYGYPTKGMLAWLGTLSADQILEVASYTLTIRGSNPPNAKGPQGELATE